MKTLLKSVKIIDPNSRFNGRIMDILLDGGKIAAIDDQIAPKNAQVVHLPNLHASPGFLDMRADFCEPGLEHKEDIRTGIKAAIKGGFTGVAVTPNTFPSTSSKSSVNFIVNTAQGYPVNVYPIGTLSDNLKGEQLSEMFDMKLAGAIAFSDDKKPVKSSSLMSRALLYAKNFDGLIISFAQDMSIVHHGQIHEGVVSTKLGLEGIPPLAEEIQLSRDLFLTAYNEGRIHFSTISTANSVDIIREAKKEGLQVSCDVAAHQIAFLDQDLEEFDSNLKVFPPFREEMDREEIIRGLMDGTIDVICSDHTPQDTEAKEQEFERADFGIVGLETAFAAACTLLRNHISLDGIIQKMAINPRSILKLEIPIIEVQYPANLTLFNPDMEWVFSSSDIVSKSKNSPFIGYKFKGKVLGIYNNSQLITN